MTGRVVAGGGAGGGAGTTVAAGTGDVTGDDDGDGVEVAGANSGVEGRAATVVALSHACDPATHATIQTNHAPRVSSDGCRRRPPTTAVDHRPSSPDVTVRESTRQLVRIASDSQPTRGSSTVPAYVSPTRRTRVNALRRRRRERLTFALSLLVIVAAIGGTVYFAHNRATPFQFELQRAEAPAPKAFDHFDFSTYWLARHGQQDLPIPAQAAFLVDLDTRQVLWERDPETSRAPASLTKLITAMVAVDDAGSLDRTITVTKRATQVVPSVMGLTAGEQLTVRDVLYGLFLDSGNDAAEALATGLVPRDRFIRQMNQKASSIGLTASHFVNPSGLDAPGHGMSAHDLAHTAAYLDTYYPELAAIAETKDYVIPATDTHKAYYPHNLNRLLWSYPGVTGLKTGLTDNAGGCMLATATRNGRHLIAVVMNDTGRSPYDATILLDYGFSVHPSAAFGPFSG